MVRRVNRHGEVLIWCRKCSGCARQRMGPQLMNCCKLEKVGTKEDGKMLKRILTFEEGRVPAEDARGWKIEGPKRRVTGKAFKILREEFEVGGFMAQKSLRNIATKRKLKDRGPSPK